MPPAVATFGLTKRYGDHAALRGIDLRVPEGAIFGFLGPNGAGKTTTIRILLGLLRATSGRAEVFGRDVRVEGVTLRRETGYLAGDLRLYDHLSGAEFLRTIDAVRGVDSGAEAARLSRSFALDLAPRIRSYSRGMKQKLGLIQALMHRPRLLILDEPTTALDPLNRETLASEVRQRAAAGVTVLFSSHTLSEVEQLCDHVAILRAGLLVEQRPVEQIRTRGLRRVEIRFADGATPAHVPEDLVIERRDERGLRGVWRGTADALIAWLATCPLAEVFVQPPDLESLFLAHYTEDGATRTDGVHA